MPKPPSSDWDQQQQQHNGPSSNNLRRSESRAGRAKAQFDQKGNRKTSILALRFWHLFPLSQQSVQVAGDDASKFHKQKAWGEAKEAPLPILAPRQRQGNFFRKSQNRGFAEQPPVRGIFFHLICDCTFFSVHSLITRFAILVHHFFTENRTFLPESAKEFGGNFFLRRIYPAVCPVVVDKTWTRSPVQSSNFSVLYLRSYGHEPCPKVCSKFTPDQGAPDIYPSQSNAKEPRTPEESDRAPNCRQGTWPEGPAPRSRQHAQAPAPGGLREEPDMDGPVPAAAQA